MEIHGPTSEDEKSRSPRAARWYHRNMTAEDVVRALMKTQKPGSFLVRESRCIPGQLVLSALTETGDVVHMRKESETSKFVIAGRLFDGFSSVVEFYMASGEFIVSCGSTFRLQYPINATDFCISDVTRRIEDLRKERSRGFREEAALLQQEHFTTPFPRDEGRKPENKPKNRFSNIVPNDETRVVLVNRGADVPGMDYINANYVWWRCGTQMALKKLYIATQTCLPNTRHDFWWMVYQEDSRVIAMISCKREKTEIKPFIPKVGCGTMYGRVKVKCISETEVRSTGTQIQMIIRKLDLALDNEPETVRAVHHCTFYGWPDHGVPSDPEGFLEFLDRIRDQQTECGELTPVVVHCRSGLGQTGTFIVADILIRQILDYGSDCVVDIHRTVLAVRRYRAGLVQTEEQYKFIYEILSLFHQNVTT